ncbi:MAG: anaerobic ribonucleoside-triphosphate reductase activating protein [Methanobacteriales archaeon]|nr:anaerobic ribonucleoside-triphosphate reductase activating protein [Methanobacteriales archaeon]
MELGGTLISSLEYPGKVSLVIFTGGCNLRCPYCHNPEMISGGKEVSQAEIEAQIVKERDFIDAVVITGGEPLLQFDEVEKLLEFSKYLGLLTKLDTNGGFPVRLSKVIKLLDYVALDVKAPFDDYYEIIGSNIGAKVKNSMELCADSKVYLECRTTYVPGLLNEKDMNEIAKSLDCDLYTIQQFRNRTVLDKNLHNTPNPSRDELFTIAKRLKPIFRNLKVKTAEFGEEMV